MEKDDPLILICTDFHHISFFLEHGRRGWDLTYLPDNFFADVDGVLATLLDKMQQISEIDGCGFAYENAVVPLRDVKSKLDTIKAMRKRIWEQTKVAYEQQQEAKEAKGEAEKRDLQLVERPKVKAVARRARGKTDVDSAFGEKAEFKAGGGTVTIEAPVQHGIEIAVEVKQEVKAGIEVQATSEVVHEAEHAEQETSRILEDVDIHPDFALFEDD